MFVMPEPRNTTLPSGLLLLGVVFWGMSFVYVKQAVSVVDVYSFLFVRFSVATVILGLFILPRFSAYTMKTLRRGVAVGLVLAVAFIAQTLGIQYTSASNAAFITGLCVVLVPLFVTVLDRRPPPAMQILAVALGFAGLALLSLKLPFHVNKGDAWCLLCAVLFGLQIVMISRMMGRVDALLFAVTQVFTVAVVAGAAGLILNRGITISRDPVVWKAVAFVAVFASAYMYAVQARYQKYLSEVKATMIYSLEPVFAGVFALWMLGETMTPRAVAGGLLIVMAMLLADWKKKGAAEKQSR